LLEQAAGPWVLRHRTLPWEVALADSLALPSDYGPLLAGLRASLPCIEQIERALADDAGDEQP
jgi:hypothetical protein